MIRIVPVVGGSRCDIGAHDGRRLRDTHVNQVRNSGATRRFDARLDRRQIDALEFPCFGRIRMGRSDEMDERHASRQRIGKRCGVERIADDRRHAGRKFVPRLRADERDDVVAARDEQFDQRAPDVPGAAGDDDAHPIA
jgi:hypothetical protein